jgi:hypothetical protein
MVEISIISIQCLVTIKNLIGPQAGGLILIETNTVEWKKKYEYCDDHNY